MVQEAEIEKIAAAVAAEIKKRQSGTKPEHMTHLSGTDLVAKTHPVIAFRGAIDLLESEIILVQHAARAEGRLSLERDLEEIRTLIHDLIRCEITGNVARIGTLCGMTDEEIHAHSHHPGQYFGIRHFVPDASIGVIPGRLNKLRALARQTELSACHTFSSSEGVADKTERQDIVRTLNRISSLFHVMMFKYMHGDYPAAMVEVEASGRHIHLSARDMETLFGAGHTLTKVKDLSQPGQYVCSERVTVCGPKGKIEHIVVLGPERKETQVEISMTDARVLGIQPVIRQSGHTDGTPGCKIIYGSRELVINKGVIVAARHVHMHPADAHRQDIRDGDFVSLQLPGERALTFDHVLVRVSDQFATYAHIDYDEANACGLKKKTLAIIKKAQS